MNGKLTIFKNQCATSCVDQALLPYKVWLNNCHAKSSYAIIGKKPWLERGKSRPPDFSWSNIFISTWEVFFQKKQNINSKRHSRNNVEGILVKRVIDKTLSGLQAITICIYFTLFRNFGSTLCAKIKKEKMEIF